MSPSAGVHCECSREETRIALCITLPLQRDLRTRLRRPKLGQSYINDSVVSCTPGHLYGCSCPAKKCALINTRVSAKLRDTHIHEYDNGVLVRICLTSRGATILLLSFFRHNTSASKNLHCYFLIGHV